jgi:hypothetical protein
VLPDEDAGQFSLRLMAIGCANSYFENGDVSSLAAFAE